MSDNCIVLLSSSDYGAGAKSAIYNYLVYAMKKRTDYRILTENILSATIHRHKPKNN